MYSLLEDLQKRLSTETLLKLADADGDGQPDAEIIEAAIADADAEIDTYLSNRYVVPFTEPPAIIRMLSTILSINNLFARLPGLLSEEHQQRAQEVRQLLQFLAEAELDLSQSPEAILRNFISSTTKDIPRIFSRENLANF